jgi:hypothetical protein
MLMIDARQRPIAHRLTTFVLNGRALLLKTPTALQVEMRDFEEAIDRVMLGMEKKSRVMSAVIFLDAPVEAYTRL